MVLSQIQKTTTKRCYNKIPLPESEIERVLAAFYAKVVESTSKTVEKPQMELKNVAKWLEYNYTKPWLVIYGNIGNGKTTTVKAIVKVYEAIKNVSQQQLKDTSCLSDRQIDQIEKRAALHVPVIYSAQDIAVIANTSAEAFEAIKKLPSLIIDDIGVEPTKVLHYGTEICPIAEILYWRYEKRLMTIMTTNLNFKQISEYYGDRIADRMTELSPRIAYKSNSYRRN